MKHHTTVVSSTHTYIDLDLLDGFYDVYGSNALSDQKVRKLIKVFKNERITSKFRKTNDS